MANPPFFLVSFHRRMFPTLRCSFSGIDQIPMHGDCRLLVMTDIVPCDNKRYRYAYHRSSWLVAGKADPPSPSRLYLHPDAPYSMEQLRKQVISFEKVKLTNNEMDKSGHVSRPLTQYDLPPPFLIAAVGTAFRAPFGLTPCDSQSLDLVH